jgi:NADH-quinone oxidoreductase subunit A
MSDAWLALFVFLALSLIVPLSMVGVAWLVQVRARKDSPLKHQTYECGEDLAGPTWIQFHPRYYILALFFVLFDVEAAFMLPWGVSVRELGVVEMAVFVAILLLGWGYAVRKGALRWQ